MTSYFQRRRLPGTIWHCNQNRAIRRRFLRFTLLFVVPALILERALAAAPASSPAAQTSNGENGVLAEKITFSPKSPSARRCLSDIVRKAFVATHDGWSSDEVLLNDERNQAYLAKCKELLPDADPVHCNWALLNARKSGKLKGIPTTRRRRDQPDDYLHAAEIAARFLQDKYELSVDRVLCCPKLRKEFDDITTSVTPDVSAYLLRKAALGLRKARQLRPELVTRVADWKKTVTTYSAQQVLEHPDLVPDCPGVYIFRDRMGYLYIGESSRLSTRVEKHLDHSDRKSLAHYLWQNGTEGITIELHAFDPDSKAKGRVARRAYESELIRSRKPRLNIAP